MKFLLSFLFCYLICTLNCKGQSCLPGGISFTTQAQIDAFPSNYPGCTSILGGVIIPGNSNITNLNGLSVLNSIGGQLWIFSAAALTDVGGLSNLSTIGDRLLFYNNDALVTLGVNGLSSLSSVGGDFRFTANDELTNLGNFPSLASIGGELLVSGNPISNLGGFSNLNTVGTYVTINGVNQISGFNNLSEIGGNLLITFNASLSNITGFNNLSSINGGILVISYNDVLNDISNSFPALNSATLDNVLIEENPLLNSCESSVICDYLSIPSNPATISGNATNCATRTAVEAACLLALPVSLNSFTARPQKTNIRLLWRTESESQNDHFDIEHSRNGVSFETIGKMAGQGTTAEAQDYQFIHQKPGSGIHYYRLKQVDFGGKYGYSPVVSIHLPGFGDLEGLALFPNPTTGLVHFSTEIPEGAGFSVSDVLGRTLLQGDLLTPQIDLSELQPGLYRVSIMSGFQSNTLLLLKE